MTWSKTLHKGRPFSKNLTDMTLKQGTNFIHFPPDWQLLVGTWWTSGEAPLCYTWTQKADSRSCIHPPSVFVRAFSGQQTRAYIDFYLYAAGLFCLRFRVGECESWCIILIMFIDNQRKTKQGCTSTCTCTFMCTSHTFCLPGIHNYPTKWVTHSTHGKTHRPVLIADILHMTGSYILTHT